MGKIDQLNKAFESRVRLGIMSILMVNDWMDYKSLKTQLNLTDGNLASHINGLEKLEYITVRKGFIGKKNEYELSHYTTWKSGLSTTYKCP